MSKTLEKIAININAYLNAMQEKTGRMPNNIGLYPKQYQAVEKALNDSTYVDGFVVESDGRYTFKGIQIQRVG